MRLAHSALVNAGWHILGAVFVAVLVLTAALCGEAATCAGCGDACCGRLPASGSARRLLAKIRASCALPVLAGTTALAPDVTPAAHAPVPQAALPVPLRI